MKGERIMARRRNNNSKEERDNFQDKAEEKEYAKGYRSGKEDYKTRRRQGARKRDFDYRPEKMVVKDTVSLPGSNDAFWYNPDDNLYRSVSGITTQAANGLPLITGALLDNPGETIGSTNPVLAIQTKGIKSPGVMVFDIIPSIGNCTQAQDPFNRANDAIFTFVRQNKSGQPIYEAPNLGMYNFAMANAYAFYEFITRAYGTTQRYSVLDWYTPKTLVNAMNLDFEDLRDNLADFRTWINSFCYELQQFASPSGIAVHERYKFLFSNIFLDEDTQKAQYYLFNPAGFWIWSEGASDNPRHPVTELTYTPLTAVSPTPTLLKFADLVEYGNNLIAPLSKSQDVRNMSADIFTVFGATNLVAPATIDEKFTVTPVCDKRAMMQIENMFIYGDTDTFVGKMYEDSGINAGYVINSETFKPSAQWVQSPYLSYTDETKPKVFISFGNIQPAKWMLNFHLDDITHDDIMEATRLCGFGYDKSIDEDAPLQEMTIYTHGSEIVSGARIWYYTYIPYTDVHDTAKLNLVSHAFDTMNYFATAIGTVSTEMLAVWSDQCDLMAMLSKFDWHPQVFMVPFTLRTINEVTGIYSMWRQDALCDISNFAELTEWQLQQMNRVALYKLFSCTSMGEFSRIVAMK